MFYVLPFAFDFYVLVFKNWSNKKKKLYNADEMNLNLFANIYFSFVEFVWPFLPIFIVVSLSGRVLALVYIVSVIAIIGICSLIHKQVKCKVAIEHVPFTSKIF